MGQDEPPEVVVTPPNASPKKKVTSNGSLPEKKVTMSSSPPSIKEEEERDWLRLDDDEFMELYTAMYNGKV